MTHSRTITTGSSGMHSSPAGISSPAIEREGVRCIPVYVWHYEAAWDVAHQVEMLLIFEQAGQVSSRRYVLTYRPIRYAELLACLEEVRFAIEASVYHDDAERYEIEARRTPI